MNKCCHFFYWSHRKKLTTLWKKATVKFEKIDCGSNMPVLDDKVLNDLSCDQKYLYDITAAVSNGVVSDDLKVRKPGSLNHSRWLTLANRDCRLNSSTENPSRSLRVITHFRVSNYAPNWFTIKCSNLCTNGTKNLHQATQLVKELLTDICPLTSQVVLQMLEGIRMRLI